MPIYGKNTIGANDDPILGGYDSAHAYVVMVRLFNITDAPIQISSAVIHGNTAFGGTNGYMRAIIADATDNGDTTFSCGAVLGYSNGITIPGSDPVQWYTMNFASSLSIPSNKLCAMGIIDYTDLGSDYSWFVLSGTQDAGYYRERGGYYDYNSPPSTLTGALGPIGGHTFDFDMYVNYTTGGGGTTYTDSGTERVALTPSAITNIQGVDSATERLALTPSGTDISGLRQIQRPIGPTAMSTSLSTLYTVPSGKKFIVRGIKICNTSGAQRAITLKMGGQSIYFNQPVDINGTLPWTGWEVMLPGEQLQAQADAAGCTIVVSGVEV